MVTGVGGTYFPKKTFPHTHSQASKYRASDFEIETTVVLNRVRAQKKFSGLTIEEVCLKRQQFSCWNAGDENLPKIKKGDTCRSGVR